MSKFLVFTGLLLVVSGFLLHFRVEIPWLTEWMGRLPGDLVIKKKGVTIYFPIATSLLVSSAVSLIFSVLFKSSK